MASNSVNAMASSLDVRRRAARTLTTTRCPRLPRVVTIAVALAGFAGAASAQTNPCGELGNSFGPFDYRTVPEQPKRLVEGAHFTPVVESLIRGNTTSRPGGDIDYTLRTMPNHHRALLATVRLGEVEKTDKPSGMRYTVGCWLDRAIRFQPDDHIVRLIFVDYLAKHGRPNDARSQLGYAEKLAGEDPIALYNIGLGYLAIGDHAKALTFAHRAMAMGLLWPDLKAQLQAAGKWSDPVPSATESPNSAAPAASSAN